ncbi:MAG: substrate-binding domain-containing protein [Kiritimatiellae bacterium]|nr:substrate-binding domain-containing protein [Kiritimatiellia bacterium]
MKTILVISIAGNPWVTRCWLRGLARYAKLAKWHLEFCSLAAHDIRERTIKRLIRYFKPDGIISTAYPGGLAGVFAKGMPVAWSGAEEEVVPPECPLVTHNNEGTAKIAAQELMALGFRDYAAIGYRPDARWSPKRIDTFRRAVESGGGRVVTFDDLDQSMDRITLQRAILQWIAKLPRPCGIFAVCDRVAVATVSVARRLGLRMPQDVALVGVDNDEDLCLTAMPTITSVAIDWNKGGFMVGEALDRRMRQPHAPPMRATFGELGIVRRASTTIAAVRVDPRVTEASTFIREHACEGIGVVDVVRRMGCSRRLAELRYKEVTGLSILAEIREVQLEHAKVLLAQRDIPLNVLSDRCGWKSPASLRAYFSEQTGMSMREWRKRNLA